MQSFTSPVLAGLFVLSVVCGCTSDYQKVAVKPVARVGQNQLTAKEFSDQLARKLKFLDSLSAKNTNNLKRIKDEILNDFIQYSLMIDWAKSQKIEISEAEVEKVIATTRAAYPDDLSFRRYLAEEGLSFSDWHQLVKKDLVLKAVFKKLDEHIAQPTDEELRKYYHEKNDKFRVKERILLSQILVAEEAAAEQILKDLKTKSFADLAKKYSIGPEGKSGGSMGWIEKGSVDFLDPLFSNSIGLLNKIVRSPFGIHIFKIEKKMPAMVRPFEEVKGQIAKVIFAKKEQAEFLKWFDNQLRINKVYKDVELINSITIVTKGANE